MEANVKIKHLLSCSFPHVHNNIILYIMTVFTIRCPVAVVATDISIFTIFIH